MESQDSAKKQSPQAQQTPDQLSPQDQLEKINQSAKQIEKEIEKLVDVMIYNPSILSRASKFWGARPLWQKIILGILIGAPLLTIGIFFHLVSLIIFSVLLAAAYTGISLLLDNNNSHNETASKSIKIKLGSIARTLNATIGLLTPLVESFKAQLVEFKEENSRLKQSLHELGAHNQTLGGKVHEFSAQEQLLQETIRSLMQQVASLESTLQNTLQALEQSQAQLRETTTRYASDEASLREQTLELQTLQQQYTQEIELYKATREKMEQLVPKIANSVQEPATKQLQDELTAFLAEDQQSKKELVARVTKAEGEAKRLRTEMQRLDTTLQQYETLINQTSALYEAVAQNTDSKPPTIPNAFSFLKRLTTQGTPHQPASRTPSSPSPQSVV